MENEENKAINPEKIATHFAQLEDLMETYDIKNPTKIFNLDEYGFSIQGMALGTDKCVLV